MFAAKCKHARCGADPQVGKGEHQNQCRCPNDVDRDIHNRDEQLTKSQMRHKRQEGETPERMCDLALALQLHPLAFGRCCVSFSLCLCRATTGFCSSCVMPPLRFCRRSRCGLLILPGLSSCCTSCLLGRSTSRLLGLRRCLLAPAFVFARIPKWLSVVSMATC